MRAYNSTKVGLDKARGMSCEGHEMGSEEQERVNSQTMSKPIAKLGTESSDRSISQEGNRKSGNPEFMGGDGTLGSPLIQEIRGQRGWYRSFLMA